MRSPIGDISLSSLSFSDDQVIFVRNVYDMEFMLQRLNKIYQKWGLNIKIFKTELTIKNSQALFTILIGDKKTIRQVNKKKFLRVMITNEKDPEQLE